MTENQDLFENRDIVEMSNDQISSDKSSKQNEIIYKKSGGSKLTKQYFHRVALTISWQSNLLVMLV